MTYQLIAFPNGERTVVATLFGVTRNFESWIGIAAMRAEVSPGAEADGIVAHAQVQAKVRGEYVDVEREGAVIATVGPEGVI